MIYSFLLLNRCHTRVVGSLSNAEKSDSFIVFYAKYQFGKLHIETITSWAASFEKSLYHTGREEDMCVFAAEE